VLYAHFVIGVALVASNALAGVLGAASWLRKSPWRAFWVLLRVAQATVVAQAGLGLALIAVGREAGGLHLFYGISPLVVALVSEGMRVAAGARELEEAGDYHALAHAEQVALARRVVLRETGVMTIGLLLNVTLALRALLAGPG
jgi:hypothetical protein